MKILIFVIFMSMSFSVNSAGLGKLVGVLLTKAGSKSTIKVTKDAGNFAATGSSKAVGTNIISSLDIPAGATLQVVMNTSKSSVATNLFKLIGGVAVISQVLQVGGAVCDLFCQDVKDWLNGGALGLDKDGKLQKLDDYQGVCNSGGANYSTPIDACTDLMYRQFGRYNTTVQSSIEGSVVSGSNASAHCSIKTKSDGLEVGGGNVVCSQIVITPTPATPEEAIDRLVKTPIPDPKFQQIVEGLHKLAEEHNDPTLEPEAENPTFPDEEFPEDDPLGGKKKTIEYPPEKEVTPDGQVIEKKPRLECKKLAPDTCECQKITDVKITNNDNSVINKTVENAPTMEDLGLQPSKPTNKTITPDYCLTHPDVLACIKLGKVPDKETIEVKEADINFNPTSLGSGGQCPAPRIIQLANGKTLTMSYQYYCDFAVKINPIIIAFSWLMAGFIVVGGLRD